MAVPITPKQFDIDKAAGVDDWRVLLSVAFATGLELVEQIGRFRGGGRPLSGSEPAFGRVGGTAGRQGALVRSYVLGDGTRLDEVDDAVTSRCRVDR